MNFLIKIEEAINNFIERLLEKIKGLIPNFFYIWISSCTHLPAIIIHKIQGSISLMKFSCSKVLGFFGQYTTMIRGYFVGFMIYFRSEEFKKTDKKTLFSIPFIYIKHHPIKSIFGGISFVILTTAIFTIYQNTQKIALGTLSLRKPSSIEKAEEDIFLEFKNHKFEVKLGPESSGGAHGAAAPAQAHEKEIFLNIKIETNTVSDKEYLEYMEEMLEDNIEALELKVSQLPLVISNQKEIEETMTKSLNEDFKRIGRDHPIKNIIVKQVLSGRPNYYRQAERMMSITDINLQIFLEDTNRNRQVWLDFSVLASNRNIVMYLKNHEIEIKDHLATNVEPVIPQLPVEEEGRLIIKDKIKSELNLYLEKNGIEGKILEIYIDYLMAS